MGRKGVSKRKTKQIKNKPAASDDSGTTVASAVQAAKNQPVRAVDAGKAFPLSKGVGKPSADRRKSPSKG